VCLRLREVENVAADVAPSLFKRDHRFSRARARELGALERRRDGGVFLGERGTLCVELERRVFFVGQPLVAR